MEPQRTASEVRGDPRLSSSRPRPGSSRIRDRRPLPATPLALTTRDGVALSALTYGPPGAPVAVVFGHGFNGSQRNRKVLELVSDLVARGFAVYTADFRGHGASAGCSTFGEREVDDLDAVVEVARRRHAQVVSVGSSMGGFVALRHAGLVGQVDAVVAISSPANASIPRMARAQLFGTVVRSEHGRRLLARCGTRVGPFTPPSASPLELAPVIAPIPVAIVHGGRDRWVPVSDAHALHDHLRAPRRLVVLPTFGHGEAGFGPGFTPILVDLIRDLLTQAPGPPPDHPDEDRALEPSPDGSPQAADGRGQWTWLAQPSRSKPRMRAADESHW